MTKTLLHRNLGCYRTMFAPHEEIVNGSSGMRMFSGFSERAFPEAEVIAAEVRSGRGVLSFECF